MSVLTRSGRVGESARRVDGVPKVTGAYAYGSDLRRRAHALGRHAFAARTPRRASARSTSPRLRGRRASRACCPPPTCPAAPTFGLEFADQPVSRTSVVRYVGEPVALVAAETLEQATAGCGSRSSVEYEPLPAVTDMEQALRPDAPLVHEFGNVLRHVHIRHGDVDAVDADVWVEGYYETAMQDQAALGPEAGLAVPAADGGVDLYVATQWLHVDRQQIAPCLGLPEEKVRITLAGVGGAFGSREDIHMQIHACLLALRTGRPVKIVYGREESFHGHVHRHPSRTLDPLRRDARRPARRRRRPAAARRRRLRVLLAGRWSPTRRHSRPGRTRCRTSRVEGTVVYTNNPPCGAMRGFGAPQVCFAYEAAMDELAGEARPRPGRAAAAERAPAPARCCRPARCSSGQHPVREVIERCAAIPLPPEEPAQGATAIAYPGGAGNVSRGEALKRGVGFAVGFKNIAYSEGFDDAAEATVTLGLRPDGPVAVDPHRRGRLRPGPLHRARADRPHRARRRRGRLRAARRRDSALPARRRRPARRR